jgi:hypothetical protein
MVRTNYQVFVQRDGAYGVALSQFGALVRTATGFSTEKDARAWILRDRLSEGADIRLSKSDITMLRAH